MGDPIRRLERELRNAVIEAIRERKSFDEIQSEIARRITAAGIEKNLGEQLRGNAVRTAQWINDRTLSTTEQRRVAAVLATSENHFAKIGGKIQRGIVDDVRRLISSDRPSSEIESVIAHRLRSTQRQAATITQTALAGFDRLTTLHQAPTATHLRYVGPPAQRDFCRDRIGRVYSLEEISSMDNGQGLTVLTYCGGYNCRHTWEPARLPNSKSEPDRITAQHFTGKAEVVLTDPASIDTASKQILGKSLSKAEMIKICGAPDGAIIKPSVLSPSSNRPSGTLRFDITHPLYSDVSTRELYVNRIGDIELNNIRLYVSDSAPDGFGARVFATQVVAARSLGVEYISTIAAGSYYGPENGYYTWARFGYQSSLTEVEISNLPSHLHGFTTVHDLMGNPFGRLWWRRWGTTRTMYFGMAPDGLSITRLKLYLAEKSIGGIDL